MRNISNPISASDSNPEMLRMVSPETPKRPRGWIALTITIGEVAVLSYFAFVLSQYWLMLPVWMRTTAALGLGLAFALVGYRFWKARKSPPP
jgi:hypothetical protein